MKYQKNKSETEKPSKEFNRLKHLKKQHILQRETLIMAVFKMSRSEKSIKILNDVFEKVLDKIH